MAYLQSSTEALEAQNLAAGGVDIVDGVDGAEVVDTGVKLYNLSAFLYHPHTSPTYTNLVHDGDAGILGLLVKLHHGV